MVFGSGVHSTPFVPFLLVGGSVWVFAGEDRIARRDANDTVVDKHFAQSSIARGSYSPNRDCQTQWFLHAASIPAIGAWGETVFAIMPFCLLILGPFSLDVEVWLAAFVRGHERRHAPRGFRDRLYVQLFATWARPFPISARRNIW